MPTPFMALLRETFHYLRNRWWTIPALLFLPCIMAGLQWKIHHRTLWDMWRMEPAPLPPTAEGVCLLMNLLMTLSLIGTGIPLPKREHTLPISTLQLVLSRIIPGMIACAASHLLIAGLFNLLMNPGLPYFGPTMLYVLSYLMFMAVAWNCRGRELQQVFFGGLTSIVLMFWFMGHYDWGRYTHNWRPLWENAVVRNALHKLLEQEYGKDAVPFVVGGVGVEEFFVWLVLVAASVALILRGAYRSRHGLILEVTASWAIKPQPESAPDISERQLLSTSSGTPPWLMYLITEMRQHGWILPTATTIFLGIIGFFYLGALVFSHVYYPRDFNDFEVPRGFATGFCFLYAIVGMTPLVNMKATQAAIDKGRLGYVETLPVSAAFLGGGSMVRAVLTAVLGIVSTAVMAQLIVFGQLGLRSLLFTQDQLIPLPSVWWWEGSTQPPDFIPTILFMTWMILTYSAIGLASTLSGRAWVAWLPLSFCVGLFIVSACSEMIFGNRGGGAPFIISGFLLAGLIIASAIKGIREKTLGPVSIGLAGLLFVAGFAGLAVTFAQMTGNPQVNVVTETEKRTLFILISISCMAPAILPTMAVAWNRHR